MPVDPLPPQTPGKRLYVFFSHQALERQKSRASQGRAHNKGARYTKLDGTVVFALWETRVPFGLKALQARWPDYEKIGEVYPDSYRKPPPIEKIRGPYRY